MIEEAIEAGEHLKKGKVILYPTDTIWGIGCDATNPEAVQRIYRIKKRPDQKSMLLLMDGIMMLNQYIESVPEQAIKLLESSTRPTTIIYQGARNLAPNLVADDGSIGIRITSDPFCRELLKLTRFPIVSTSANLSGLQAPSSFGEIDDLIKREVDYVVNWRQEETGPAAASTILRIDNQGEIKVLRP
jgi:L-threonylcarbamoyladenylate synthase